ncbi:ribonuclease H-like domain-containing protein [Tanacetum coccineum]
MTMRTKPDVDTLSIDDLYNNLRVFEQELTSTKIMQCAQNVALFHTARAALNKVKSGHTGATVNFQRLIISKEFPHPLTRDYTPKPQEKIDYSMYVYGKKGPQKPKISDSDDNSTKHSTCQSNDSEGSFGNPSEHSSESESESIIWNNANRVNRANHFVPRPVQLNTGRANVNTGRQRSLDLVGILLGYKRMKLSWHFRNFIRQIENQLSHRVKIMRSDNGTEFKNRDMLEFYGNKGMKQEYSNARTPQQNGVAKRMNRTLIEAARTMLADLLLPTTF